MHLTQRCNSHHTTNGTRTLNGPLSETTQMSRYQKGKTNLDFTEARDSEWQWHQLGHMQASTFIQTDNLTSTPPLSFLQAGCPSCRPNQQCQSTEGKSTDNFHIYVVMEKVLKNITAYCPLVTVNNQTVTTRNQPTIPTTESSI